MNIKKVIEKIERGSCRNVTHAEMRQLATHIKDLDLENERLNYIIGSQDRIDAYALSLGANKAELEKLRNSG